MVRLCICVLILTCVIFSEQQDEPAFTSPVLKRNRRNYLTFNGKTYFFGTVFKSNFFRAMQYCRQQGMHLVSISNQAEQDRLGKFAAEIGARNGRFWTSGTNFIEDNQFVWMSTGNNIIYGHWDSDQPSLKSLTGTPEHCVEVRIGVRGFSLNDEDCNMEAYFICEKSENCNSKK